jgi:uncharacterized protein YjiS (DUF1127 family)
MQFENVSSGRDAIMARLPVGAPSYPPFRAHRPAPGVSPGDPPRPRIDLATWRRRIAAALSAAKEAIVTHFAFAAVGLYPELLWPLIEHVDERDLAREDRCDFSPTRRSAGGHSTHRFAEAEDWPGSSAGIPCFRPAAVGTSIAALASLAAALRSRLRRRREARRMRADWQMLDDRTLKDIGISRNEIQFVVRGEQRWR